MAAPALMLGRPEPANAPGVLLTRWDLGCRVGAANFTADGHHAAFGLADGTIRMVELDRFSARRMAASQVHDGPICDLVPDKAGGGTLSLSRHGVAAAMETRGCVSEIHEPSGADDEARAIATGASGLRAVVTADQALLYVTRRAVSRLRIGTPGAFRCRSTRRAGAWRSRGRFVLSVRQDRRRP